MAQKKEAMARSKILTMLRERKGYVSGEEMSNRLKLSRTAVWKHMNELKEAGYVIESVRKSGYRLVEEPDRLTATELQAGLNTSWLGQQVIYEAAVESTQKIAHRLAAEGAAHGTVVIADKQTKGKGRLGRNWHSPGKKGIWTSLILRPQIPIHKTPQFTLLAAVSVVKGLQDFPGITCEIKWPNDVMYGGRKLAGILTELEAEADHVHFVIIGCGINVNTERHEMLREIKEVATSVAIACGQKVKRAPILQSILRQFEKFYNLYVENGFQAIKYMWESYALTIGKTVKAKTLTGEIIGKAHGITDEGYLIIVDAHGKQHAISSADVTIGSHDAL